MLSATKKIVYGFCYALRNTVDPFCMFEEIAILAYHSISDAGVDTAITTETLEKQLCYLRDKGFSFVSLEEVVAWADAAQKNPADRNKKERLRKAVAITFDDGYADFETAALPLLEKYAAPATLFVIGAGYTSADVRKNVQNDIPLLSPEALNRVSQSEFVEIGYHSMTHANLAKISGTELEKEIVSTMRYFAYPGGNYSDEALKEVEKSGYNAAFSIKRHLVKRGQNRYLFPRTVVTKDMEPWMVGAHVTKAIEWYRAITNSVKNS